MSVRNFLELVQATPGSVALRESDLGYALLLSTHVASLCLFAGLIIMMDLRLAGIGNLLTPISQIQKRLFPWQMVGFSLSAMTGLAMIFAQPMKYYGKVFFWGKFALMILAGLNAILFHLTTYRYVGAWDDNVVPPLTARLAGYVSLALWAGVIVFGRLTAYPWLTTQY